jgi:hypothetical protein
MPAAMTSAKHLPKLELPHGDYRRGRRDAALVAARTAPLHGLEIHGIATPDAC